MATRRPDIFTNTTIRSKNFGGLENGFALNLITSLFAYNFTNTDHCNTTGTSSKYTTEMAATKPPSFDTINISGPLPPN